MQKLNANNKTNHEETQSKQEISQSPSKNDLLEAMMSQRHGDYYCFVKTVSLIFFRLLVSIGRFFAYFGIHSILRGSKNRPFSKQIRNNEKKKVQEAASKQIDILIDFDAAKSEA